MNHKKKVKLARKLSGKSTEHFDSDEWKNHSENVSRSVARREAIQKEASSKRKMRILDDKGKEHKVGEIFTSETLTIEI